MKPDRPLPDDLARLGLYLEVAAGETLRRRQRRPAMVNFIGAVTLAVPFALAVAAADLAPERRVLPGPRGDLARVPAADQRLHGPAHPGRAMPTPTRSPASMLTTAAHPSPPSLQPAPAGKH